MRVCVCVWRRRATYAQSNARTSQRPVQDAQAQLLPQTRHTSWIHHLVAFVVLTSARAEEKTERGRDGVRDRQSVCVCEHARECMCVVKKGESACACVCVCVRASVEKESHRHAKHSRERTRASAALASTAGTNLNQKTCHGSMPWLPWRASKRQQERVWATHRPC